MAVRVVPDAMASRAPALENFRAMGIIHALADREQKCARLPQVPQQALVRFRSAIIRDELPPDIIHRDGNSRPRLREQGSGAQNQRLTTGDAHHFPPGVISR
jgi:hypothetical protein